jgi:dienelactone hydrolase
MCKMDEDASAATREYVREQWNQARRKAFWKRLSNTLGLTKEPVGLLSFEEVQQKLRLTQNAYRGLQQVPLDQIVGSVGRYNDFTRTFLPLIESDSMRWQRVAELQVEAGLPPIELYKVGDAYFVKDGNHRVSVARQFGMKTIEAYVWEYESKVGGLPGTPDVEALIVRAEYRAFLDRTQLEITRPDQQIVLTEPGMYPALELEIEMYRQNLERIDVEPHSYKDAASAWYDMVYTLAVDVIRQSGVLQLFPGRTEADLYVWVSRNRRELSEQYGTSVSMRDAVARIVETQQRPGTVGRVMHSVMGLVHNLTAADHEETQEFVVAPAEDEPLGKLLSQIDRYEARMAYQGERGDAWRDWRGALRAKVGNLLGLSYVPAHQVEVETIESVAVSGVEREKILLQAGDGIQLPAYVMYPAEAEGPRPALLVYPGHGTIQQTAGIEHSRHRGNALALAQAGYVTITVEERGFGELGDVDHISLDNVARLVGRTWLGMTIEDGLRALDYLQTRPDVKPTHLGVTGLGLGGGLALYTAALDERVRAVVIENYLGGGIDPLVVHAHGCDFVPGLRRYAELSDVARTIVPRPYPRGRSSTAVARGWFDKMRPSYELFLCPDRTRFVEHESGDSYDSMIAQSWFERWLIEEQDTSVLLWAPRE